jgi:hypothetical protein
LVEQHFNGSVLSSQELDFIGLSATYEQRGIWGFSVAGDTRNRLKPSCSCEQTQLFKL